MPLTITNQSGDGVTADLLDVSLQLPDSGTSVTLSGRVVVKGGAGQAITGSPLTMPTAPATGSVFWNVQVDSISGAATVQQSTTADPAPISSTNRVVFRQTLTPTSNDAATTPESTPDSW